MPSLEKTTTETVMVTNPTQPLPVLGLLPSGSDLAPSSLKAEEDLQETDEFPDGGLKAWLVVAGTFSSLFCTLGFSNSFGVFQTYYKLRVMPKEGFDDIAWIGSIQFFLIFAVGVVGGPLFDRYGPWIIRPAVVIYLFSIMMISISKSYWHFMLSHGIVNGVATGFIVPPALAAVSQWFNHKRGAAMGISMAGASVGGVFFPSILTCLLTKTDIGFAWSLRIIAFIMFPFLTFSCLAIKARLPPCPAKFFLWYSFKNAMYVLLNVAMFCALLGAFAPFVLVSTYAISRGMDETLADYLVAVLNGSFSFGCIVPGVVGDKVGNVNALIGGMTGTAIVSFFWTKAESNTAIILFTVVFGFVVATIVTAGSVAVTLCADSPKNIGTYLGMSLALSSFSTILGPPISGAMADRYHGFEELSYFSASTILLGALLAAVAKSYSAVGIFGRI